MVVPGATPVATPEDEPMVAIAILALLHKPPELASVNIEDVLTQIYGEPDITAGGGLTVNSMVE